MRFSIYFTFSLFFISFLVPDSSRGEVPRQVSFGGAGRAGVSRIALFSNPASAALIRHNRIFYSYSQTRVPGRGKDITMGIYDATNPKIKGGLSYTTEERPQLFREEEKVYDRRIIRALAAQRIFGALFAGVSVHYVMNQSLEDESKLFYTNVGLFYPLLKDLHLGITLDNIFKQREEARVFGLGLRTSVGAVSVFGDFAWPFSRVESEEDEIKGSYSWSIATEVALFAQFKFRKSWFEDVHRQTRGEAIGFSWEGPRADIEYAAREIEGSPGQKDHTLGINVEI